MSKTPNYDTKIKAILDAIKPGERVCALTGEKWNMTEEEISWYRKFNVPPSRLSPITRIRKLNGFNTGLAVFWKNDVHGKSIFSAVHPDSPIQIMEDTEWFEMNMDSYARVPSDNYSIMEQMWKMMTTVPINATRNDAEVKNSVVVGSIKATDCYLVNANLSRRCFYGYAILQCEDCVDVVNTTDASRCYHISGCEHVADSAFLFECGSCRDCTFLFDCEDCESCFGAVNKKHKRYLWFGESLSEQEWKKRRLQVDLSDQKQRQKWEEQFYYHWRTEAVWPPTFSSGNTDTDGECMNQCVRCHSCYWQGKSTDCYYSRFGVENVGCAFTSGCGWQTDAYVCTGGIYGTHNKFCMNCSKTTSCEYCTFCIGCDDCFACFGMKRSQFCIFNKQYSEKEYWKLIDKLKCRMLEEGSYGEFFEAKFSPSSFPFSTGEMYFGYSHSDLEQYGALVFDPKRGQLLTHQSSVQSKLTTVSLPATIEEFETAQMVGKPIYDPAVQRNYSITSAEFQIYKEKRWPFPQEHFIVRLTNLVRHANSPIPQNVPCGRCGAIVQTYKNFIFPERCVYCRGCYLNYLEQKS